MNDWNGLEQSVAVEGLKRAAVVSQRLNVWNDLNREAVERLERLELLEPLERLEQLSVAR